MFRGALVSFCFNMEYRLITAVSGFPCLYDRSSPTYRDLNMRSDAWREVSQLVGVNGERLRGRLFHTILAKYSHLSSV